MSKELWIAEHDRLCEEAEERLGRPLTDAEISALADGTQASMMERLYDQADALRDRMKYEGPLPAAPKD